MFGFSIPKILVLIFLILIIWHFFKFFEQKSRYKENLKDSKNNEKKKDEEQLLECKKCGGFYNEKKYSLCPICREN
tara:strand:- start:2835 stop:3062 length:228 start_codon:yes stop_codon:yes gene_type:complete